MVQAAPAAPALPGAPAYRYHFPAADAGAIARCLDERGFAVARGVAPLDLVRELEAEVARVVDPAGTLPPTASRYAMEFIEHAPPLWRLLEHGPFIGLCRALLGSDDIVLHRSAAIVRMPGSPGMGWHSDQPLERHEFPRDRDEVLNHVETAGGWLYLDGCHPRRGGLAVIEGSHREDWRGPAGYRLVPELKTFARAGEPGDQLCPDFPVPGMVAIEADPGDLVLFAKRTFHAALPHRGDRPRLSCGIGLRRRDQPCEVPWQLPISARQFREALPARLRRFADGYPGIVDWAPAVRR